MTTCQDVAKVTGQRLLFLGVDTINWNLTQFTQAAQFAKTHKIDTLMVKVADGGNTWYNGISGWQDIKKAIQAQGVGAIPYTYSYGNKYGALSTEINLLKAYIADSGVVCADMEVEWNGCIDWAETLCAAMLPVPGIFLVSTWGNPVEQNWSGVIQALNPCVNAYMPQMYTNYLASCWHEYGALGAACIAPTVMIGNDFGPNDPVAITAATHSQGHTAISIWYYDLAVANTGLLDNILNAFPVNVAIQGDDEVTQAEYDTLYQKHVALENAYNDAVAKKDALITENSTLTTKLSTLQNAWNIVVPKKNDLITQVASLQAKINANKTAPDVAALQAEVDQLQSTLAQINTLSDSAA